MADENDKLPSEIRDAWRADEPPAGFAERTAAAWQAERAGQMQRAQRRGRSIAVGAATLAVAAALLVWLRPSPVGRERVGDYEVAVRTTLDVGGRATAVAEAGAALSWKVSGGAARVEQRAGDVFYRVEKGGPFVVATAAGDVTVLGTCFRVEVQPMDRKSLVAGSVGAVAAASLMVTVYEGRVLLANEHGKTELAAGERGSVRGGAAPAKLALTSAATSAPVVPLPPPASDVTRDELLKRDEAQRQELAQLRARVHDLEAHSINPDGRGSGDAFFNPSKAELAQMAKECKLQWDSPGVEITPHKVGDKQAQKWGLSDEERRQMDAVTATFNENMLSQLRSLYVEVTGDKNGADTLSPRAMEEEIQKKVPEPMAQEAYWRLSHERAGLIPPSTDTANASPIERYLRLMTTSGDVYEKELGAAIGPDRAHDLRTENGGWGWRSTASTGCPEGKQ